MTRVVVTNRDGRVVEVADGQTILEAAEAGGVVLPYGCRYGGCVTCAARQPTDCKLEVGVRSHFRGLYRNKFRSSARLQTDLLDD